MPKRRDFDNAEMMRMKTLLKSLPKKEREPKRVSTPELVKAMRGEIRAAMARGYTLDEVITALNNEGNFDLKAPTIKRYLTETPKRRTSSAMRGRFTGERADDTRPTATRSATVDLPAAEDL